MDMSRFRDMFVTEAREHLGTMGDTILEMEKAPATPGLVDALLRSAHSLKGMAASMEYPEIAALAHRMEELLDRIRKGAVPFDAGAADLLLAGVDLLGRMVGAVTAGDGVTDDAGPLVEQLIACGAAPEGGGTGNPPPGRVAEGSPPPADVSPLAGGQWTVRVRAEVLDRLMAVAGELITSKNRLATLGEEMGDGRFREAVGDLSRLVRELRDEVTDLRMLPFSTICERLPRMVRNLARRSGKEAVLEVAGKELELDRGLLELLSDPLVHLVRNAVDHGIEPPGERTAAGKGSRGRILLAVSRERDHVVVTVSDDGRGMDPERIVAAAEEKGFIPPGEGERLSRGEAFMLTCLPGFSTAAAVTDLSGRGVGMDAVLAAMRQAGGSLSIHSEPGGGSSITLRLPLSVAIIPVLLAACGSRAVALPVTAVIRTVELERDAIIREGKRRFFMLGEERVPLLALGTLLGIPSSGPAGEIVPVVTSNAGGRMVGLSVDRLLGQTEVFARPLGRPLARARGLSGSAVLGDGRVIFILDLVNLLGPLEGPPRFAFSHAGIAQGGTG
ncbi:chemotaxis protein CheA [Geobacter sp.]|uniref:chemotaxis protein CheA n=1 Tax=Geobacter sp. TaxID=46610 RepID=UPI00262854CE|nr:chemotaxis protein CheA [Geobacter sp.]